MEKIIKKAEILIEALPYIQKLSGKTVVIKYGGNAMINDELKNSVMEDITLLKYVGVNPVVVHGGGPDISKALESFDIKSEFVDGLRITDEKTMEVAQMVLSGKTNKEIVSILNSNGNKAIGLSGIDGNIIQCSKYEPTINGNKQDIGYVGKIETVDAKVIEDFTKGDYIPVIAPIGIGKDGKSYNINADTVAGAVAIALKAEKLILLTDVEGVRLSEDSTDIESFLSVDDVHKYIDSKVITGGMIPKVLGCVEAAEQGVSRTHIIDGRIPHCILLEIFTRKGIGTMIAQKDKLYYDSEKGL